VSGRDLLFRIFMKCHPARPLRGCGENPVSIKQKAPHICRGMASNFRRPRRAALALHVTPAEGAASAHPFTPAKGRGRGREQRLDLDPEDAPEIESARRQFGHGAPGGRPLDGDRPNYGQSCLIPRLPARTAKSCLRHCRSDAGQRL
jgi:hypothetical protein